MQIDEAMSKGSFQHDMHAIMEASGNLGGHVLELMGFGTGVGTILNWVALATGIYLFVIDRTEWRTNILTALLVPYIALNLPEIIFHFARSQIGYWVAFVLVVLRLFFPKHFPHQADLPASLIVLLVVTPTLVVDVRYHWYGDVISILIGGYLLFEHLTVADGGFKKAFAERGVPITIGIILLFVSPVWGLIFGH